MRILHFEPEPDRSHGPALGDVTYMWCYSTGSAAFPAQS